MAIYPFDPAITTGGPGYSLPPDTVKVEIGRSDVANSGGCGSAQLKDPVTGQMVVQPGSTEWTVDGIPAYLYVYAAGEGEGGFSLAPGITIIYKGYCFLIVAYFTQTQPDVQTFLQIVESFKFTF